MKFNYNGSVHGLCCPRTRFTGAGPTTRVDRLNSGNVIPLSVLFSLRGCLSICFYDVPQEGMPPPA